MWNGFDFMNIITRLIHMPKACPYILIDTTAIYKNQKHRSFACAFI